MSDNHLTDAKLATLYGVTRQTIISWRKPEFLEKYPGMGDLQNERQTRAAMVQYDLGKPGAKGSASGQALKEEKLRTEIALNNAKLDREQRRSIAKAEVDRLLLHISSRSRTMLYQFLETEAPPKLDGLTAAQQRPILREMADSICDAMADMIKGLDEA